MVKSQSSDTTNLSRYCSFESLKRRAAARSQTVEKEKNETNLEKFLREKDMPAWYRALSGSQLNAADSLFDNIRDDMEQGTTYRCRRALIRLGLFPLETNANIKLCLNLSRGNDLAFLWFLMELFYKDTCTDCVHPKNKYNVNEEIIRTTIAHLDMVTTLRELDKLLPQRTIVPKQKPPKRAKINVDANVSPYLMPLPKPPVIIKSQNKSPPVKQITLEPRYQIYTDPNYVVKNESNRWYALPEEERVDLDFGVNSPEKTAKIIEKVIEDVIKRIFSENFDKNKVFEALCTTHKEKKETDEHLQHILQVAIRAQNENHFNLGDRKKRRRKKAAERLEKSAKAYHEKCEQEVEEIETRTWIRTFIEDLIFKSTFEEVRRKCPSLGACPVNQIDDTSCTRALQCECYCEVDREYFDYGHFGTPKPNQIYFHAPGKHAPYKFEYEKIFKDDYRDKRDPVKTAISNALDLDNYANEDEAIAVWMKNIWQTEVETFRTAYDKAMESARKIEDKQIKIFDPRNNNQMKCLLRKAFKKMRENPKFVFASMPDAYKHPEIKQFIKQRYGFVLTKKEKTKALKQSKKILTFLRKFKINMRTPKKVGFAKEISYNCRDYVFNKGNQIAANFFHNLRMLLLQASSVCWLAMEPFHVPQGALRDIFYAYMPSREYDTKTIRPWKKNEYMDAENAWEKRLKKRRDEEKNRL